MTDVLVLPTIADLEGDPIDPSVSTVFVEAYSRASSYNAKSTRGGGLFQRVLSGTSPAPTRDGVLIFKNGSTFWTRNLNGGVVDAYMAGAVGGAALDSDGAVPVGSHDDSGAINLLLQTLAKYRSIQSGSLALRFAIGDGVFYVENSLWVPSFNAGTHGWVVEGTGATILGACPKAPILDLTDRRFCTVRNLQVIGVLDANGRPISSCGIRIGRNGGNNAANQMTMDHVGIRGHFKLAAMLNVGSEQFAAIGCECANEAEGDTYGYAGDGFNCLQWTRPVGFSGIDKIISDSTYSVSGVAIPGLKAGDKILVRTAQEDVEFLTTLLTVQSVASDRSSFVVEDFGGEDSYDDGVYYKQLYGGAVDTPGFTPPGSRTRASSSFTSRATTAPRAAWPASSRPATASISTRWSTRPPAIIRKRTRRERPRPRR